MHVCCNKIYLKSFIMQARRRMTNPNFTDLCEGLFLPEVSEANQRLCMLTVRTEFFDVAVIPRDDENSECEKNKHKIRVSGMKGSKIFIEVGYGCVSLATAKVGIIPELIYAYDLKAELEFIPYDPQLPRRNQNILKDILDDPEYYSNKLIESDLDILVRVEGAYGRGLFTLEQARAFTMDELDQIAEEYYQAIVGKEDKFHTLIKDQIIQEHFHGLRATRLKMYFNALRKKFELLGEHGVMYDADM